MDSEKKVEENIKKVRVDNFPNELNVKLINKNPLITPSLIVSVISILIALFALLNSFGFFSSFNLEITSSGTYVFPLGDENHEVVSMTFFIPIEFLNVGSRDGFVEDIRLEVGCDECEGKINYTAINEIDLSQLNQKESWLNMDYFTKPFQGFGIKGGEIITKTISFNVEKMPGYVLLLTIGNYTLDIFVKTSKDENYENKESFTIKINQRGVDNIKNHNRAFFRRDGKQSYTKYNINHTS